MIYNGFKDIKISALGLGCMRFPVLEDGKTIDMEKTSAIVDYAISNGINYFDTAWGYHDGMSETVMGELLSRYPRESYFLTSKFPGYDLSNMDKVEEIFEAQLKKCRTDYFDFYLFHSLTEGNINEYLDDEKYGIYSYLIEQKRKGRIRHLGLSNHSSLETLKRFLDAYGKDIEFCQIQLNWLDWDYQDAKAKVEYLNECNIPIWVMEPVRGGRLAALAPKYDRILRDAAPNRAPAEWAFRYIQTIPGVTVTLSGMSNMQQIEDNVRIFNEKKPLSEKETAILYEIAAEMMEKHDLPCTSCRYCTTHCPVELDIPKLIELYNNTSKIATGGYISPKEMALIDESKRPSACIGCRSCESVCPQGIKISEMMADFALKSK